MVPGELSKGDEMEGRAKDLIDVLGLRPHPEGGYFREVYRSAARVQPLDGRADRLALTTIYFLLLPARRRAGEPLAPGGIRRGLALLRRRAARTDGCGSRLQRDLAARAGTCWRQRRTGAGRSGG